MGLFSRLFKNSIVFIDTEVSVKEKKVIDSGAYKYGGQQLHSKKAAEFDRFISGHSYICGHNIIHHDLNYVEPWVGHNISSKAIDTLYLSPLLFPKTPYHKLVKDDKLSVDQLNNPLNDAQKSAELFYDEINAFEALSDDLKAIFYSLLKNKREFSSFFDYIDYGSDVYIPVNEKIAVAFKNRICNNAPIWQLINSNPVELAYSLALINTDDKNSLTPPWLLNNYPDIVDVIKKLRNTPCNDFSCEYCREKLNARNGLKQWFGYPAFRTYNGEPLQEKAATAAIEGKSLLAVFPTGGGKSITFQLPALMSGESERGLTVVISPLQSLMKDQVDNLAAKNIVNAVTINGLLDPIERKDAIERVKSGLATLLYISPESLRSKTILNLLMTRNVVRFVIDEAHCFSAWGQDFRVDYLFIAEFIKQLQEKKGLITPIPVSCFTATAKQKVISDICEYFREGLGINLELFATSSDRENLHYNVLFREDNKEKYETLRRLIQERNCPTIVYVSRTKRTRELADKLTKDGFPALPYNGKMESEQKIQNQEAFKSGEVNIIVATSAFGMGVDKDDVKLVVHFDISDSLENYVQEAGRAGRNPELQAECVVLFNNEDLDKHFILLNQTKLSFAEIQEVWRAIKYLSSNRPGISCSALEIARQAGWEDVVDIETRVKAAVSALESAGYVTRGMNVPHVYATSIQASNMEEASKKLADSTFFAESEKSQASHILSFLIGSRSVKKAAEEDAESRVDYIADCTGLPLEDVISIVTKLKLAGLLSDENDMSAFINNTDNENRAHNIVKKFSVLEQFLLNQLTEYGFESDVKTLNDTALNANIKSTTKDIKTIQYFLAIKKYMVKHEDAETGAIRMVPNLPIQKIKERANRRNNICNYIINRLYKQSGSAPQTEKEIPVEFSVIDLYKGYLEYETGTLGLDALTVADIEEALLYLSKIGAMRIEDGFLVIYNAMHIVRLERNNAIKYKKEDYRKLQDYYTQKTQQIHIVGKYAHLMASDYDKAVEFVHDYFMMEYNSFINKYFNADEKTAMSRNLTADKYKALFDKLSSSQLKIIDDASSQYIVVAAGPGSGKTMLLAHKLASLLMLEDVKHEQLLMLTFSRAAATEFKNRLYSLIGNAAKTVEIKTFHSYCFDLLGKIGKLEGVENVVKEATDFINSEEAEPGKIIKKVLVIDEAQDMDAEEFALVEAIINKNENLRIIAVGDDDQNIYAFRGSDSVYMKNFITKYNAKLYEMVDNYRSNSKVIDLANAFVPTITDRMKETPIRAMNDSDGSVQLIYHSGANMIESLINHVIEKYDKDKKICVLTDKNDEALQVLGLLQKKNVPAKLIQSMDGFNLLQLVEVRAFVNYIGENLHTPKIDAKLWGKAKVYIHNKFNRSPVLITVYNMLDAFETAYPLLYKSDLDTFIAESKLEDFTETGAGTVVVSTIHKSKGREFDKVFMLLDNVSVQNDEDRRKIYVGITRAKTELYVHFNSNVFKGTNYPDSTEKIHDKTNYQEPSEALLQLGYSDVFLGLFKEKQDLIKHLQAGDKLTINNGGYMMTTVDGKTVQIGKISKAASETLKRLEHRGYTVYDATIRFIVYWKGQDEEKEILIVLPDIYCRKG